MKKAVLLAGVACSFMFADNFIIRSESGKQPEAAKEERRHSSDAPQRVVIEDVNPASEMGQLIGNMLKQSENKKETPVAVVVEKAPEVKKVVAKKKKPKVVCKPVKTKKKKPTAKKTVINAESKKSSVQMEVKSEDPAKVGEKEKKEAEHNESNSSLKKVSGAHG
jgi:hypothetical protein